MIIDILPSALESPGLRFDVPLLKTHGEAEAEILLLGWALLMRRYSTEGGCRFAWGICDDGGLSNPTFELAASSFEWTAETLLSEALADVRSCVKNVSGIRPGTSLFFNDESIPENLSGRVTWNGSTAQWGNVQIQATVSDVLILRPSWREPQGGAWLAEHLAYSFAEILKQMDLSAPIPTVSVGERDAAVLWNWNRTLPPVVEVCLQDLILEQVQKHPDKQAVCSWDGNLSYAEVDEYSTLLARQLVGMGLQVGDMVPLCFEKCRWTTVAVLAVMKAGGAFVLMDPSQPVQRRQAMAEQVGARYILMSQSVADLGPVIAPQATTVVVTENTFTQTDAQLSPRLPFISPDSVLYIIFTSGSTGKPKGVVISHATYTTSALARSADIGYTDVSRVLDFTSYAFDVSIDSMLCTLLRGGCLCIPSDGDRMNDLSAAMRRLGVNVANMTPSVAQILDADIIPSLNSLGIGGEACSASDISIWGQYTRVVVGYGPAECTIGCTVNPSAAGKPYVSMGVAKGCAIWLVHPDDHDKLVPVGAVGELLIEGPIVGQGYLGDPEKTEAAFIRDPAWLGAGCAGIPGRRGRLYKTGDLVRHDPDGERGFIFVGRKDSQVKLRGQRVELGEIEHHVKKLLGAEADVAVEVIAPGGQEKASMLVAFIADRRDRNSTNEPGVVKLSQALQDAVDVVNGKLAEVLPVYMLPSAYVGLSTIPMLVSGKMDRKTLRAIGSAMSLQTLSGDAKDASVPASEAERCLQTIWGQLLNLPQDTLYRDSNFFILGGDSLLAMKMVPAVREEGFELSVAQVFGYPVLADMAREMKKLEGSAATEAIPAFSLLNSSCNLESVLQEAASHCEIDASSIEDIYPCAPMQEIHMAFYTRSEGYVAQRIAPIPDQQTAEKLQAAWDAVIKECSILRTRIVEFKNHGFLQVVTKEVQWQTSDNLASFLEEDKKAPMGVNSPLCRFTMVHDAQTEKRYFVWTAHHAVYDGWSTDLIVDRVKKAYTGETVRRSAEFKHFIKYLADGQSADYWLAQLDGATGPQFPALPSRSYIPQPTALEERFIPVTNKSDITASTVFRAAWALVASQYSMNDDVVFGETLTGRSLPVPGIEEIEGPLLATIPVRIHVDRTASVYEYLRLIQDQGVARAAHQHFGIQNIRRLSSDALVACEVSMGMVIQPAAAERAGDLPEFEAGDAAMEALRFNTYPVMLACVLMDGGFRVVASYDGSLVAEGQMRRVLRQLECAVGELCGDTERRVGDVSCLGADELDEIWKMNARPPVALDGISMGLARGAAYPAVRYVPWVVDSENYSRLMPVGAVGELLLEGPGEASIDAPEWLRKGASGVDGRQGRLLATGDLVSYSDQMELVYIGRKSEVKQVNGRVVDLDLVDGQLSRLLPRGVTVRSRLVVPHDSSSSVPLVVALVQEPGGQDRVIDLGFDTAEIALSSTVSADLVKAILGLKKAMLDVVPPYMIPTVCIPVAALEEACTQQDIPLALISHVRTCFENVPPSSLAAVELTPAERLLRSLWAKFLSVAEDTLTLDDNFFRLGGDSILAMRIVSALRQDGYALSVADMFRNMKLRNMADAIVMPAPEESVSTPIESTSEYSPFSLVGADVLATDVAPLLAESSWTIEDMMPVTYPQARDVSRTVSRPRSSVQYNMLHMDGPLDTQRLEDSLQHLVHLHPILRTVFVQHNDSTLQVVLQVLQMDMSRHTCPDDQTLEQYARTLAAEDVEIDSSFQLGRSFTRVFLLSRQGKDSLMMRLSHAQYDGVSLPLLLHHLHLLYRGDTMQIAPAAPFSRYMQHLSVSRPTNKHYWQDQLRGSQPSEIITPANATSATTRFFTRSVDVSSRPSDITLATLLTAGWAHVLATHLSTTDVTFGGIVSGRTAPVDGVEGIMAPCYQYMPVRVRFQPGWTAGELLRHVRDLYLEGSARATLSYDELRDCAQWQGGEDSAFYASFVNHLEGREGFFDTMAFGEGECRVDYSLPHGEPATPPRVVSFVEGGQSMLGIEADAERGGFWEERLRDLGGVVELFARDDGFVVGDGMGWAAHEL